MNDGKRARSGIKKRGKAKRALGLVGGAAAKKTLAAAGDRAEPAAEKRAAEEKRVAAAKRTDAAAGKIDRVDRGVVTPVSKESESLLAGWFPLWLAAAGFDVTRQAFHDHVRPLIPKSDIRGAGEKGTEVKFRSAIDAWVSHKMGAKAAANDELLFGGPDSPWLEKVREYTAGLKKIELEEKQKMLIPRAQLQPALGQFAAALRRAAETLQRQFGDDAASLINEAVNEAVSIWEKMLKELA